MRFNVYTTVGLLLAFMGTSHAAAPEGFRAFSEKHCVSCHGPEKQKGKLRLDTLAWEPSNPENIEIWYEIADLLEFDEMPPEDEPQPTDAEKAGILTALHHSLEAGEDDATRESVSLRRLNRLQYRNTLRDLLNIDVTDDPTSGFPSDGLTHGFDTVSKSLVTSNFVMQSYLKAADLAVSRASYFEESPPLARTYQLEPFRGVILHPDQNYFDLATTDYSIVDFPKKFEIAPQGERFRFAIEVEGLPDDEDGRELFQKLGYNRNDEIVLGIYLHQADSGLVERAIIESYSLTVLPAGKRHIIEEEIHIPHGWQLLVRYETGPVGFRPWRSGDTFPEVDIEIAKPDVIRGRDRAAAGLRGIKDKVIPRIRVHSATLEGPLNSEWPPESHQRLYGSEQSNEKIIRDFAERAFRRPVGEEELAPFIALAGAGPESLQSGIRAVLCAPQFTYFYENEGRLDDYAIASRLAYFLWNSMPDEELLTLARQQQLRTPSVLELQVERLLEDPRSESFRNTFVYQWLHLKNAFEMPPARSSFPSYYTWEVQDGMIEETVAFFSHLLDQNLPLSHLISSDYLVTNTTMAKFYGIDGVHHFDYQPVSLPGSRQYRSGLLGQASVLTASANGVETSPVVRGIWVLENLLGTPPAAPPDDIGVPEPDVRGARTVRELLAKHRDIESCNDCHRSIDPIGFALENFDPVGLWREHYPALDPETDKVIQGREIDAAGTYAGEEFSNISGLKEILLQKEKLITRNLIDKLLLSGTGREMGVADRPAIDTIVEQLDSTNGGMRDLLKAVIQSEIFLTK
ncbi:MAG: DUF1592 domain-containing protein [Verrucomicrobiales bacterium]|nr:DUF1592 domain-containing protein [Verrucomicrobiales bacterium]